jgi:hypothetical protein
VALLAKQKSLPYNEVEIGIRQRIRISDEMIDNYFQLESRKEMELQVKRNWTGSNA